MAFLGTAMTLAHTIRAIALGFHWGLIAFYVIAAFFVFLFKTQYKEYKKNRDGIDCL
jgi:hypothetical protein